VEIASPSGYLDVDQTLQLSATSRDVMGGAITTEITWSSSAPAIAEVDPRGVVTGRAPGAVYIRASAGGVADSVRLTVETPVAELEALPDSLFLVQGRSGKLVVEMRDASGRPMAHSLTFSSSASGVATVSPTGEVQGLALGGATVTLTAGRRQVQVPVRVVTGERYGIRVLEGERPSWAPSGINNRGEIVGFPLLDGPGQRGLLWRGGRLTDLGPGQAWAVNDSGTVVLTEYRYPGRLELVLWKEGGRTVVADTLFSSILSVLPGSLISHRASINLRGEAVVTIMVQAGPGVYPMFSARWTRQGLAGLPSHSPPALNDRGEIVVNRGSYRHSFLPQRALIWRDGDTTAVPQPRAAADWWRLSAIDDRGRAVGYYGTGTSEPLETRGWFLWDGSRTTDLGPLPGSPVAMNGYGDVLGVEYGRRLFVVRGSRTIDLTDQLADWTIESAGRMNDLGQVVATGRHRATGERRALLLTPAP
jgi:hypothetical protein